MPEIEPEDWLTYAEAGQLLGKTPEAVRALARRQHWPRQTPNLPGGHARVKMPAVTGVDRPRPALTVEQPPSTDGQMTGQGSGSDRVGDDVVRAFDRALEALRQELEHERGRADRAERRADSLQDELTRERCRAVAIQRKLIEVLTGPRVPWWRRWFR